MRYSRQELLREIGKEGQQKLNGSNVVIIGAGALGSVSSDLLVRSGVNVKIIDRDFIELSNLQRSGFFREEDIGYPKASRAAYILEKINPEIRSEGIDSDLNSSNIEKLIGKPDLILDASDNMKTRFLINDYAKKNRIPWIYLGGVGTEGMMLAIEDKPCLECLLGKEVKGTDTCDTVGVLNVLTHVMASIQVRDALRILLGEPVCHDLIRVDIWKGEMEQIPIDPREDCNACKGEYKHLGKSDEIIELCGSNAFHIRGHDVNLLELKEKLEKLGEVKYLQNVLHVKMDNDEITVFSDGRAIVKADTKKKAKSLYSRYVGD